MKPDVKWMTPACAAVVTFSFLLPFISLRSEDDELKKQTGIEMVRGALIPYYDAVAHTSSEPESEKSPFAIAALVLALAQVILSFLIRFRHPGFMSFIGFAGGLSLLLLRVKLDSSLGKWLEESNIAARLHLEYLYGYWIALVFSILNGALNLFAFIEKQQQELNDA